MATNSGNKKTTARKSNTTKRSTQGTRKSSSSSGTRKSSSTAKRPQSKPSTKKKAEPRYETNENDFNFVYELVLLGIIFVFIFLFLCVIGVISSKNPDSPNLGDFVQNVMFGLFGVGSYILTIGTPVLIVLAYFSKTRSGLIKIICAGIIVILFGMFAHMAAYKDLEDYMHVEHVIKTFYEGCGGVSGIAKGGGVIFGMPTMWLSGLLGRVGSILVLAILALACILVITGKSIISLIVTLRNKADEEYDNASDEDDDNYEDEEYRVKKPGFFARLLGTSDEDDEEDEEPEVEEYRYIPKAQRMKEQEKPKLRSERKSTGVTFNTDLKGTNDNPPVSEPVVTSKPVQSASIQEVFVPPVVEEIIEEPVKEVSAPVIKKDIHQIVVDYDENDNSLDASDDWIRPVSTANKITELKPEPKPVVKEVSEITPEFEEEYYEEAEEQYVPPVMPKAPEPVKPDSDMKEVKLTSNGEAVAHLRSRDKSEMSKGLDSMKVKPPKKRSPYKLPTVDMLSKPVGSSGGSDKSELDETANSLVEVLAAFGVNVTMLGYSKGPAVTRYELQPATGVKVSKILSLADDIKLNLGAPDIRIEAPIPGKQAVGIEVPNKDSSAVSFRELVDSPEFKNSEAGICFAVGKDISGQRVIADIGKMPHLLVAGATGSGKSVCINTLIMSILYKYKPDEIKLIMVDPKVVELNVYNGLPHLLVPVVTDPKQASAALKWGVTEMERRYKLFADAAVRDLKGYNEKALNGEVDSDGAPIKKLPKIVIIVDELADLMMVAGKEVEESICRLAQLARACGIHLIIATQRPSVDVITGLIKANMPSRIAFSVSSGIDSRTILDSNGAEKLLGKGDMLFFPQGYTKPARVQGCFVSDKEVNTVCDFIRGQDYCDDEESEVIKEQITSGAVGSAGSASGGDNDFDEYFADAGRLIIEKDKASIGYLQRAFKIGFNRAARIMDQLEEAGVVGPEEGTKPRHIIMTMDEFENYLMN